MTPTAARDAAPVRDVLGATSAHNSPHDGAGLALHSRFVQRVQRRYGDGLGLLGAAPIDAANLQSCFDAFIQQGLAVGTALRVLRQTVLARLVHDDCEQGADLHTVTAAMTHLAEFALDTACVHAMQALDARYGPPRTPGGARAALWIVGMGKLGARELNVSSDIDLIYVYDHAGQTDGVGEGVEGGRAAISNQEYFGQVVKAIHALIGDTTEHGFVFRVDLALRPNGNSGPAAVSLDALEEYFHVQGREWERFAWLKSRVVAPASAVADRSAQALRGVVLPFVFRRYLDYSVMDALRVLHGQIRSHATRRAAGRPERSNDVKLSRGGIREIEFTVQLLQVVRGGQFPELRTRSTLDALQRLAHAGVMPEATAQALALAYKFLRRTEHRIQYLDDQQTHVLPVQDEDLQWIARTMGAPDCCAFLAELDTHREFVAHEFDKLLALPQAGDSAGCGCAGPRAAQRPAAPLDLAVAMEGLAEQASEAFASRVAAWREHPKVLALRDASRQRLALLVQRTAQWMATAGPDALPAAGRQEAALRWLDWMETLLRRESYLALLQERPQVHMRLLRLLGAARWPARYLLTHPGVIDELANGTMLAERFDAPGFEAELHARRAALQSTGEDDEEALLNLLRRAHHAEVFRTLARDVEKRLTVEQVADDLSALADSVLRTTFAWCWHSLKGRHQEVPQLAIIGYGKLGGKELGYGSDLDIVFVYDDPHERAGEIYAGFVRRLIHWLSVKTAEGDLFEIDTALRPNGGSGLLVSTMSAYANYQRQRGSNAAWTWEHQAMTRARFVLGYEALRAPFDAVRDAVICAPREEASLGNEILAMRDKVRAAHPAKRGEAPALFDVKHGAGGMVDAEFAVQYMVLLHACGEPRLRANVGNIALLHQLDACGLLADSGDANIGAQAADAYRQLRRLQHAARLDERPTSVPGSEVTAQRAAIRRLWQAVFKAHAAG